MKKIKNIISYGLFLIMGGFFCLTVSAQNVGINSTGASPDASAILDISSSDKGLLAPRVALTATGSASPVTSPATSLLVYNTATASDVTPGYYYWDGAKWVRLINQANASGGDWSLTGNAGTTPGTHFLGTTDNQNLMFRTNNTERLRLTSTGELGVGTNFTIDPPYKITLLGDNVANDNDMIKVSNVPNLANGEINTLISAGLSIWTWANIDIASLKVITEHSGINRYGLQFCTMGHFSENQAQPRMTLSGVGDLGIGTTTPASSLDIHDNVALIRLEDNNNLYSENGSKSYISFNASDDNIGFVGDGSSNSNDMQIHSNNDIRVSTNGTSTLRLFVSAEGNTCIGDGTVFGANAQHVLMIRNGTAPTTSSNNSIQLYAQDVSASSELRVRDEAGNITTLSPHNFEDIPGGKSEELAWAFYSKRGGKSINVDMAKLARTVEKLSAENLVYIKDETTGEVSTANLESELTKNQLVAKIVALEQRNVIQERRLQQLEQQIQTLINE